VYSLGVRIWGSGLRFEALGFRVQGSSFRVQGFRVQDSVSRVEGLRFKVCGVGHGVQGSGFKVED